MSIVSRFNSNPSADYTKALAAGRELSDDKRERLAAELFSQDRLSLFLGKYHAKALSYRGHEPYAKVMYKFLYRKTTNSDDVLYRKLFLVDSARPPRSDHEDLWIRDNGTYIFTYQPYDQMSLSDLTDLIEWCKHWNLTCEINADESWHYPGKTLLIIIQQERLENV